LAGFYQGPVGFDQGEVFFFFFRGDGRLFHR
jgi:hypothetical protein